MSQGYSVIDENSFLWNIKTSDIKEMISPGYTGLKGSSIHNMFLEFRNSNKANVLKPLIPDKLGKYSKITRSRNFNHRINEDSDLLLKIIDECLKKLENE